MFTKTDYGEKILFCLIEAAAQEMAKREIDRRLTDEELYQVQKGLEFGFEFWEEVMRTAIEEAVKTSKV